MQERSREKVFAGRHHKVCRKNGFKEPAVDDKDSYKTVVCVMFSISDKTLTCYVSNIKLKSSVR